MRTFLLRLWRHLRRFFMNDDQPIEPTSEDRPPPDERIGRELQEFFLELLQGDNLKRYQGEGRDSYLSERSTRLSGDAQRLLSSGDLREIEAHIGQITGSRAVILYVVCPPM
jgi:hypothetical protein